SAAAARRMAAGEAGRSTAGRESTRVRAEWTCAPARGGGGMAKGAGSPGKAIRDAWERCRRLPAGERLFSWALGRMVPYSGSIGAVVRELAPGRARVELADRRRVRNHL